MLFQSKLQFLADDIVKLTKPLKIFVFGSVARGAKYPRDIDLLIVIPTGQNTREVAQKLYASLTRRGMPIDLVVIDEAQLREQEHDHWSVISVALSEGTLLYAA